MEVVVVMEKVLDGEVAEDEEEEVVMEVVEVKEVYRGGGGPDNHSLLICYV